MSMQIRVRTSDLYIDECKTRIPFRFGMTTMTSAGFRAMPALG